MGTAVIGSPLRFNSPPAHGCLGKRGSSVARVFRPVQIPDVLCEKLCIFLMWWKIGVYFYFYIYVYLISILHVYIF